MIDRNSGSYNLSIRWNHWISHIAAGEGEHSTTTTSAANMRFDKTECLNCALIERLQAPRWYYAKVNETRAEKGDNSRNVCRGARTLSYDTVIGRSGMEKRQTQIPTFANIVHLGS